MAADLGASLGLVGLFLAAFLAASLLPFPVEATVPVVLALGSSTLAVVVVGTVGGYLGSLVNYGLAGAGSSWWERRHPETRSLVRARAAFQRWGPPLLLLSWLPIIGEAVTVVAGVARVPLGIFTVWTVIGRVVRMLALVQVSIWIFG